MSCSDCPDDNIKSPVNYLGWRAWYDTGDVYCSRSNNWKDIPDDGVIAVVVYLSRDNSIEKRILESSWYIFVDQDSRSPIIYGSEDIIKDDVYARYPGCSIKRGKFTDDDMFYRIEKVALESEW